MTPRCPIIGPLLYGTGSHRHQRSFGDNSWSLPYSLEQRRSYIYTESPYFILQHIIFHLAIHHKITPPSSITIPQSPSHPTTALCAMISKYLLRRLSAPPIKCSITAYLSFSITISRRETRRRVGDCCTRGRELSTPLPLPPVSVFSPQSTWDWFRSKIWDDHYCTGMIAPNGKSTFRLWEKLQIRSYQDILGVQSCLQNPLKKRPS